MKVYVLESTHTHRRSMRYGRVTERRRCPVCICAHISTASCVVFVVILSNVTATDCLQELSTYVSTDKQIVLTVAALAFALTVS